MGGDCGSVVNACPYRPSRGGIERVRITDPAQFQMTESFGSRAVTHHKNTTPLDTDAGVRFRGPLFVRSSHFCTWSVGRMYDTDASGSPRISTHHETIQPRFTETPLTPIPDSNPSIFRPTSIDHPSIECLSLGAHLRKEPAEGR